MRGCSPGSPNGGRLAGMNRSYWIIAAWALFAGMAIAYAADFEVTGPDGRRILLKEDGTWRYVDKKGKESAREDAKKAAKRLEKEDDEKEPVKEAAKEKPKALGEAVLRLERKTEIGSNCRFDVRLVNDLNYEIRSIAPTFSAHRASGVVYDSVLSTFQSVRPGDSQVREVQFRGIACGDVARLQVGGADRCVMGELDRWTAELGQCLTRVRVVESSLVRFDKDAPKEAAGEEPASKEAKGKEAAGKDAKK